MNSRREELVFVINKFEFSVPFPILIIKNPDFSMPDLMRHQSKRHNRKYPVIKHSIQKRPGTVGLPNRLHKNMMLRSILLKQLPGSASLFTHSKRFPHKILYLNAFFPIKWMILSHRKHQAVINNRKNSKIRRKDFPLHNSHIQLRAKKLLLNILGIAHIRMDPNLRAVLLKPGNQKGRQTSSHRNSRTQLQCGRLPLIQHQFLQLLKLPDQISRLGKQKLAPFCEIQLLSQSFKKKTIVMLFQLPNGLAHRRLRQI